MRGCACGYVTIKIILIPDSRKMEKLWAGTGRKGNAIVIFTHTHTHTIRAKNSAGMIQKKI